MSEKNNLKDSATKEIVKKKTIEELEIELKGFDRIIGYSGIMLTLILPIIHNEMIDQPEKTDAFIFAFLLTGIYILLLFIYYFFRSKEKTKLLALNLADTISVYCPIVFILDIAFIFLSRIPLNKVSFFTLFSSFVFGLMLGLTYLFYRQSKKEYTN